MNLSDYETSELVDVLDTLEKEYYETWKPLNGGFAEAEYVSCNEDIVFIEVRHGIQSMGSGHSETHTDELEISRGILRDYKLDTEGKIAYIA